MFFLKTVIQINSLRKLNRFLHHIRPFRASCGLSLFLIFLLFHVRHFGFREEGIPVIHEKVLQGT